jgi:hypothetical protein
VFREHDDQQADLEDFDEIEKLQHQGINAGDVKVCALDFEL